MKQVELPAAQKTVPASPVCEHEELPALKEDEPSICVNLSVPADLPPSIQEWE